MVFQQLECWPQWLHNHKLRLKQLEQLQQALHLWHQYHAQLLACVELWIAY
jgi:hypothetical protein